MPQFETFRKSLVPPAQPPVVTVHKRGTITLNAGAFAVLGRPAAVELLYDRVTAVLGLRTVDPALPHAAYVRQAHPSASGPWIISAMAFVKYFGIDTSVTRRWPAAMQDGTLTADLARPGEAVGRASVRKSVRPRSSPGGRRGGRP